MKHDSPSGKDPFVAAIEAKIAAWQNVIESYKTAVALDRPLGDVRTANGNGGAQDPVPGRPSGLPVGVFRGKGIKEAIPVFLAFRQRKQTNKQIAQGLMDGGIASTAKNFESAVATALGRLKDEGVVLRFADGWDLAESYPEGLRNRLSRDREPRHQPRRAGKVEPAPHEGRDKTAAILSTIAKSSGLTHGGIVDALRADGLEVSPDYVRVVTRRLRKRGQVDIRDGTVYPA